MKKIVLLLLLAIVSQADSSNFEGVFDNKAKFKCPDTTLMWLENNSGFAYYGTKSKKALGLLKLTYKDEPYIQLKFPDNSHLAENQLVQILLKVNALLRAKFTRRRLKRDYKMMRVLTSKTPESFVEICQSIGLQGSDPLTCGLLPRDKVLAKAAPRPKPFEAGETFEGPKLVWDENIGTELYHLHFPREEPTEEAPLFQGFRILHGGEEIGNTVLIFDELQKVVDIAFFGFWPQHCKKGWGTASMALLLKALRQNRTNYPDITIIVLCTDPNNIGMTKIAKRFGFEVNPQQTDNKLVDYIKLLDPAANKRPDVSPKGDNNNSHPHMLKETYEEIKPGIPFNLWLESLPSMHPNHPFKQGDKFPGKGENSAITLVWDTKILIEQAKESINTSHIRAYCTGFKIVRTKDEAYLGYITLEYYPGLPKAVGVQFAWIRKEERRKGYMTMALRHVFEIIKRNLPSYPKAEYLSLYTDPHNDGMISTAKKAWMGHYTTDWATPKFFHLRRPFDDSKSEPHDQMKENLGKFNCIMARLSDK